MGLTWFMMVIPDDDVRIIPIPLASPSHIAQPSSWRPIRPRLRYVGYADLIWVREYLQPGSLLSRTLFLLDLQIRKGPRVDVLALALRRPNIILVLVECDHQRSVSCSMCEAMTVACIQADSNAHFGVHGTGLVRDIVLDETCEADDGGEDTDDIEDGLYAGHFVGVQDDNLGDWGS